MATSELLRLSWRIACENVIQNAHHDESDSKTSISTPNATEKKKEKTHGANLTLELGGQTSFLKFHVEFMNAYFQFCPEIKDKFPKDFLLIAKMIKSFIVKLIEGKTSKDTLIQKFVKSHRAYKLKEEHFDGFGAALVQTVQRRLGRFGTIQIVNIWRTAVAGLTKDLQVAYNK